MPSVEQQSILASAPDMVTYGKIIGAGMPVGAYGGRKEIMEMVSPAGPVYQAGTLSGNPIAMAAGLTQLKYLHAHQEVYKDLEAKGQKLYGGMIDILNRSRFSLSGKSRIVSWKYVSLQKKK